LCRECRAAYTRAYRLRPEVRARRKLERERASPESKERKRRYDAAWRKRSPKYEAAVKRYWQSEKGKAARKRFFSSPKGKAARSRGNARERAVHPDRARARIAVIKAVQRGKLTRPDACERCGVACQPEGHHHHGYAARLDVVWLCKRCHNEATQKERRS
jgi:hypothetical protein